MSEQIRVLHIVGAMRPGGMENYIMNLYTHIDRSRVQFDFAVHARDERDYGAEIERLGGHIYLLPRLTRHPVRSLLALKRLVRENHYDVAVRHTANAVAAPQLLMAKRAGAVTICHAHSETDPAILVHKLGRLILRRAADVRLACSEKAGQWMFGSLDYQIVRNAIDIPRFQYDAEAETRIRDELHLQNAHIYGHIGNFFIAKNHLFLLRIFREILSQDAQAVLLCLGDGSLRPQIEEDIRALDLEDHVILAGMRRDVTACMSAMDILLFPSIYEGLPITLIEAQAASLPAIISDTITRDVIITEGLVSQRSIEDVPGGWAAEACAIVRTQTALSKKESRIQQRETISAHGYDIEQLCGWMMELLTQLTAEKTA